MRECFDKLGNELSIIVVDFYRPQETQLCLQSIRQNVKFDKYEIIYVCNEAVNDYSYEFYKNGLCDKLILSKRNEGLAFALIRAIEYANTEYVLFCCNDNAIIRPIEQKEFDEMKEALSQPDAGLINFVGFSEFSEKFFLIKRDLYLSVDYSGSSIGPWRNGPKTSEMELHEWIKANNKKIIQWNRYPNLLYDLGKYSVEATAFGGLLKHRRDTQELKVLIPPTQKDPSYEYTDDEWSLILNGKWPDWKIPEAKKRWTFFYFSDKLESDS